MSSDTSYSAIRTILGRSDRRERWHLTDEVDVVTALGRSVFDLRRVETTGRAVVEIGITCLLGSVRLIVPPGTMVVLDGTSFLASASSVVRPGGSSGFPRVEVTATTVLGKVKIISLEDDGFPADELTPGPTTTVPGEPADAVADDGTADAVPNDEADAPEPLAS